MKIKIFPIQGENVKKNSEWNRENWHFLLLEVHLRYSTWVALFSIIALASNITVPQISQGRDAEDFWFKNKQKITMLQLSS